MDTQNYQHTTRTRLAAVVVGVAAFSSLALAQDGEIRGTTYTNPRAAVESVSTINARAANDNSFFRWIRIPKKTETQDIGRGRLPQNPDSPTVSSTGGASIQGDDKGARGGIYSPQTVDFQFSGPGLSDTPGFVPPDVQGDISPTQIIVGVNGRIRSYDRNGNASGVNATTDAFFQSVRNNSGISDPRVRWDRLSQRWFIIAINVSSPNRLVVAVSNGPTVTATSSFSFYFLTTPSAFADYPTLGIDNNALYVGENTFNTSLTSFLGCNVWVINKANLLAGSITGTRFNVCGAASEGPFTPQGVDNDNSAATEGYFVGVSNVAFGRLAVRRVNTPGGTPTISGNILVTVPTTANPLDAPSPGAALPLDTLDDRLFNATIRRDRITGVRSLVTSHNIRVNQSGAGSSSGDRTGVRWYELGNLTATPTVLQSGTSWDNAASAPQFTWMPSISKSGQGHFAIAQNRGNSTTRVQIGAAGRLRTDAAGTTQANSLVFQSNFNYNIGSQNGALRWGDYSMVVVDPLDDQTMWGFHEFVNATNSWQVRVFRLRAPAPAAITNVSPNSFAQGASNQACVVTGTSTAGTEFYDTDPNFPNRLVATVSGSGVTVNTVTWNSITQVTLDLSVSGGAATGLRDLTIVNPDGQSVTLAGAINITGGSQQVEIAPSAFNVQFGQVNAGNVASLGAVDGNALRICKFIVPNQVVAPVTFDITGTAPTSNATALSFRSVVRMFNSGSFSQTLDLFDWTTNAYSPVDVRTDAINTSYQTFDLVGTGTLSRYINAGSGNTMKSRIQIRKTGPSSASLWCVEHDRLAWIGTFN